MKIMTKQDIQKVLHIPTILNAIEEGFVIYSQREAVVPPVSTLYFDHPPGDIHIKYGYTKKGRYYVVKVASTFYENSSLGLPSGNGLMLLFDKATGKPEVLLLDEGFLTDLRTPVAGCIAAKYFTPKNISCIGIVGTGMQAYWQLKLLPYVTNCRKVKVWGRYESKIRKFCENPELAEFQLQAELNLKQLCAECNLIVTTTSASSPLLLASQIREGTHITAVGADDVGKQELDPRLFSMADRIIVDSREQCLQFGDTSYAFKEGRLKSSQIFELGEAILNPQKRRHSDDQLMIVDLTGIAIQDLQIAMSVSKDG
ncbi:hypothetical protein pah_c008o076 [Parachlamydia acanthamoebae str. Hall's coccus]|nr:hypothetical protein pah_c008o076 [Parachlamydia acanthamoebae str. Hall's coccus]